MIRPITIKQEQGLQKRTFQFRIFIKDYESKILQELFSDTT